mmetsp:Transcript_1906/g.5701  ORF Transcript_1906/g.5701 Transcript_1906/m.5701 type:complete len:285 (+) Transcript_1906:191-1045(+)
MGRKAVGAGRERLEGAFRAHTCLTHCLAPHCIPPPSLYLPFRLLRSSSTVVVAIPRLRALASCACCSSSGGWSSGMGLRSSHSSSSSTPAFGSSPRATARQPSSKLYVRRATGLKKETTRLSVSTAIQSSLSRSSTEKPPRFLSRRARHASTTMSAMRCMCAREWPVAKTMCSHSGEWPRRSIASTSMPPSASIAATTSSTDSGWLRTTGMCCGSGALVGGCQCSVRAPPAPPPRGKLSSDSGAPSARATASKVSAALAALAKGPCWMLTPSTVASTWKLPSSR